MKLWRLVYISESVRLMPNDDLVELVEHSRQKNEEIGVSGLLLHSGGHFIQVLEGEQLLVSSLFHKISRDPRHFEVRQLLSHGIDRRLFGDWGMKLAQTDGVLPMDRDAVQKRLFRLRLSDGNEAEAAATALSLLEEFRHQVMEQCA